jgi:hypothetical protein
MTRRRLLLSIRNIQNGHDGIEVVVAPNVFGLSPGELRDLRFMYDAALEPPTSSSGFGGGGGFSGGFSGGGGR